MSRAQKKKDKNEISALPFNSKTHVTLGKKKICYNLCQRFAFLTTRAGWKVSKIYDHYTFK